MASDYASFLANKVGKTEWHGFEPIELPSCMHGHQAHLADWHIRKGCSAGFVDCGLGKSLIELVFGDNVVRHTGGRFLIVTPLAVTSQFVREGEKFGIECHKVREGQSFPGINVTNYEQLHHYDPHDFDGASADESGAIKDFTSRRRKVVTEFFKRVRYRLLATATPAPNDFVELGTSSEAIGDLGHQDMLSRFFKNDDKSIFLHGTKYGDLTQKNWRFKPHAEESFWRWVCSWARACRRPSDLGFSDDGFDLPPLLLNQHDVKPLRTANGMLFDVGAKTLSEQKEVERRTVPERCERVAELVSARSDASVVWCNLNAESDLCERLITGAIQVSGSDSDEAKEEKLAAFSSGEAKKLVTKGKCAGWGLNWQHCSHQTYFVAHSFEMWYQCVRRSWRFGQDRPVTVDVVTTDGSANVLANLRRKQAAADKMFARLVEFMHRFQAIGRSEYGYEPPVVPSWLVETQAIGAA